jgi:hypothetical protein
VRGQRPNGAGRASQQTPRVPGSGRAPWKATLP